jgi:hypothetical protein
MTDDQFTEVVDAISTHGNAARALRETGASNREFYARLAESTSDAERYARARAQGMDALVDSMVQDAEEARGADKDGVAAARLLIDTKKFLAVKLRPKVYGEHLHLEHSGNIGSEMVTRLADARKRLTQTPQPPDEEVA